MSVSGQPGGITELGSLTYDNLIASGRPLAVGITLEQDAGAVAGEYIRGRLLVKDVDGKYHFVSSTETTVALNATGEVIRNNLLAASGVAPLPFTLANPPIPGTVHLATTADGSATILKELGTDNGQGVGVGADGWFTIDYATGRGVAYLNTAATDTNDLKAGYKYRAIDPADSGETIVGLPTAILAEDILLAAIVAGDVVTAAYVEGEFLASGLSGYSSGYKDHLRSVGIIVR